MIEIVEYLTRQGRSPFAKWFNSLDIQAAAKITKALTRIERGNFSNVKSLKAGVREYKINYGPGYRIYFGKDNEKLVVLLAGGTKKRQQKDIENAIAYWLDYKKRKGT